MNEVFEKIYANRKQMEKEVFNLDTGQTETGYDIVKVRKVCVEEGVSFYEFLKFAQAKVVMEN
ncbi:MULTISPECIES: hypothetical protein [Vagococcus]|uniref:Uncharacterized protein n=1 Tax=Vagococcus fluvialis bH819 TaxID=1255619 RepID=A0A1X6WS73_9ENTE|nr:MULTISPECIES: hypothetical protein [Vagococcus]SLM87118.1 hypothetical protein FM121_13550 [Vagococcus fluvialis bH819]HCM90602.1 hypothetical protein [Vagococcus sp.]